MSKYRKIDPRIWRDERFAVLTADEKLVAIYCLTAQSNRCGLFVFSPAMAAEELGTSPHTFRERFGNVVSALRWRWDEGRRVLYFPTWWKYNPPENENVLRGNLKDLAALPETALIYEFCDNTAYLPEQLRETFLERMGERYPKPCRDQKQYQEQYQKQEQEPPPGGGSTPEPKAPPRKGDKPHPLFDRFWAPYPHKTAKAKAAQAFAKIDPDEALLERILAALSWQSCSEAWRKDGGKFIPHPATWLNGKRWEDEPPKPAIASPDAAPAEDPQERMKRIQAMYDAEQARKAGGA
jgi:hypothetical protein